jgi:prepilin-type N-terminal cleavage/methylation domain-containing protein
MSIIPPSKKPGFTLIEIVIVLAVAALIMVLVFVAVNGALMARRNDQRRSDARRVLAAVESNPDKYTCSPVSPATSCTGTILSSSLNLGSFLRDPNGAVYNIKVNINQPAGGNFPSIWIGKDAKCNDQERFDFAADAKGSNAVMIYLEPKTDIPATETSPASTAGTLYCINS